VSSKSTFPVTSCDKLGSDAGGGIPEGCFDATRQLYEFFLE
jgi:hypothetical protein